LHHILSPGKRLRQQVRTIASAEISAERRH
jgi:hypothetical protein